MDKNILFLFNFFFFTFAVFHSFAMPRSRNNRKHRFSRIMEHLCVLWNSVSEQQKINFIEKGYARSVARQQQTEWISISDSDFSLLFRYRLHSQVSGLAGSISCFAFRLHNKHALHASLHELNSMITIEANCYSLQTSVSCIKAEIQLESHLYAWNNECEE